MGGDLDLKTRIRKTRIGRGGYWRCPMCRGWSCGKKRCGHCLCDVEDLRRMEAEDADVRYREDWD